MRKADLTKKVAKTTGLTITDTTNVIDATFDAIKEELLAGGEFRIEGFATFSVATRAARMARNPATGEQVPVPEKKALKMKVSSVMKKALNGEK